MAGGTSAGTVGNREQGPPWHAWRDAADLPADEREQGGERPGVEGVHVRGVEQHGAPVVSVFVGDDQDKAAAGSDDARPLLQGPDVVDVVLEVVPGDNRVHRLW